MGWLSDMGSSPLTRGKRQQIARRLDDQGLIPAHAGKTGIGIAVAAYWGAHPRSRGENTCTPTPLDPWTGSSPLTRGKRRDGLEWDQLGGLIPAHAGKTIRLAALSRKSWAHPRSRGENVHDATFVPVSGGSSPLTRGKLPRRARHRRRYVAHPRSRGENRRAPDRRQQRSGSSPLTRGKLQTLGSTVSAVWLIPAHAGKTWFPGRRDGRRGAHPRSRGENNKGGDGTGTAPGSSPLTRGKRDLTKGQVVAFGLIPAHAGKTNRGRGRAPHHQAHPRSRGENEVRRRSA